MPCHFDAASFLLGLEQVATQSYPFASVIREGTLALLHCSRLQPVAISCVHEAGSDLSMVVLWNQGQE